MRLFLHGKLGISKLLERIEQAQNDENNNESRQTGASLEESTSFSFSSFSSWSSSTSRYYSSLLLSNWNMEEMDQAVVNALESFLRTPTPSTQKHQPQSERKPCNEILTSMSSFSSLLSSLDSPVPGDAQRTSEVPSREVILQNCEGKRRLEDLIALLMETNSSLTIRYDKQRKLPTHVAKGLHKGAKEFAEHNATCDVDIYRHSSLKSLALKGMTLTPLAANYLEMTLPLLPNFEKLIIHGNFTLFELNAQKCSIVGHEVSKMVRVIESLHRLLLKIPRLKYLDLERCHLPDEYLADILDTLCPQSIETLNLNGNMANEESQHVLHRILSHHTCRLSHLDLSWQRLPNAKRNYSILDIGMLVTALENRNTSLTTLNLSENRLLDEDVACLGVTLSKHPNLSRLSLQGCRISDQGMLALAYSLPKCSEHLKHLFLDGKQNIRDHVLVRKVIFESVLKNCYLRELALPYDISSKSISWALELNRAGRRALLGEPSAVDCPDPAIECTLSAAPSFDSQTGVNHIQDSLWPRVLERADRVARQEYLDEESSTTKAASAIYLLFREKGYHSILR